MDGKEPAASCRGEGAGPARLRPLGVPRPVLVRAGQDGVPRAVQLRGRWHRVAAIAEEWRVVDGWWREREVRRQYVQLVLADGRPVTVFCDLLDGQWYRQRDG